MKISSKLNELKPTDLNCNVFDVYSYDGLSMQELLCQFFTKINECIKVSNDTIELSSWLVNEGLKIEVVKKLMLWLEDGTLENLINVNLFNTLNTKIEIVKNDYIYLEEEYIKTSNYDNAFKNCFEKIKNGNKRILILPNKTINLNEGLVIDFNVHIKGSYKTKLYFNNSDNSNCIQLTNCRVILENFQIVGEKCLNGLSLVNSIDKPVVDSVFKNLRIEGFNVGIKTEYTWDISFYDTRVHNCTTACIFGSQSNQIAFNSCRFSSFTKGFSFINCEVITFRNCDFVNGTTLVYNHFQSFVSIYDPYIEHITDKFVFGGYNENSVSTLHIEGGLVTGNDKTMNICIQNRKPSSISINNVLYNGFSIKLKDNTHIPQLANFKLNDIRGCIPCESIKEYKGDKDITSVYSKIYGGNQLTTTINSNYATISPAQWNGVIISDSLEVGETYTVVIEARTTNAFIISQSNQQQVQLDFRDNFKRLILPFVALSNKLVFGEGIGASGTSIDIKELSIYKGVYSE